MFDALRKLIRKPDAQPDPNTSIGHYVTDPDQIIHLLNQARHTGTLLTTSFPGESGRFATAVLGVYDEYDLVALDEMTPRRGHDLLLEHGEIDLSGFMEGVDLRFKTELTESRTQDGVAFYMVIIPERLFYLQRRSDHRVSPASSGIPFQGYREQQGQQLLHGHLFDLSRNGVGVILQGIPTIQRGEIISGCTLPLSKEKTITFSVETRFISKNKRRGVTRLGCRFKKVDKETLKEIKTVVVHLERDEARHIKEQEKSPLTFTPPLIKKGNS